MNINGVVHCFFEQSGAFKNAFQSLGYYAFDYDIEDNFNQVDFKVDLFSEIEKAYNGSDSVFDLVSSDDLSLFFFPCTWFSNDNLLFFNGKSATFKRFSRCQMLSSILNRSRSRQRAYELLLMLFSIYESRSLRFVLEQPYSGYHYLKSNFPYVPSYIDLNRSLRGDIFRKPTQYFFLNCSPSRTFSYSPSLRLCRVKDFPGSHIERSVISCDYALSFIQDVILGSSSCLRQDDFFS